MVTRDLKIKVRGNSRDMVAVDRWWYYALLVVFWLNLLSGVTAFIGWWR